MERFPRGEEERSGSPRRCAQEARGEFAPEPSRSAKQGRPTFAAVVDDALRRGVMRATSACSEDDVESVERAMGLELPREYRSLLLTHGPCVIATEPATTMTPLAELHAVTGKWTSSHRDLRALRALWPTISPSVLIADYLDDQAVSLRACQGEHAGKVFVVAHDADIEPSPDDLASWLTTLLER